MQYTETELAKLIETVEKEFTAHLTKAEEAHKATLAKSEGAENSAAPAPLAKAEDEKPAEKKDESKADESKEAAPEKKDAAPAAESKEEAKEKPAEEAQDAKADEKPAESKEAAPSEDGESHGYDDEDMEHMQKMYMSMSKGELKAHHDSVRRALDSQGMQKCGDMTMGKSEDAASTQAAETKPADIKVETATQNTETEMLKSELAKAKSEADGFKKNLDAVQEFLTKFVGKIQAPKGKAITEVATIAKSENEAVNVSEMSKSEVTKILLAKSTDPKLSKADRDAINAFYLNGANYNTISHLLKN